MRMLRLGHLQQSITFYTEVLGMSVLREEKFQRGSLI